jgi:hypothetical protein
MRSTLALILFALPLACGGEALIGRDGGAPSDSSAVDGGVGADGVGGEDSGDATPADAGIDCGQPAHDTYTCPHSADAGSAVCHRYGGPNDVAPADAGFSQGCVVTLATCNRDYFTPQTCNCELFPGGDGAPQWICPL